MKTNTKLLALAASTIAMLASAQAQAATTVNATILADNGSIAVLEQGAGNFNVIASSVSGNWPTPRTFSFQVDDAPQAMARCRIHVIAWGDGAVAQGVMAHFAGTGGVAFTGQSGGPLNSVRMSSVTHSGGIAAGLAFANNNTNAAAIINSTSGVGPGFTSQPAVTGGIAGTWGPVNLPAGMEGSNQVAFVWNGNQSQLNANPNNYRVLTMPCQQVVRPAQPQPHVASWEIAGQFSSTSNPFEVWSYGYKEAADCSGAFVKLNNTFTRPWTSQTIRGWRRGPNANSNNDLPEVAQTTPVTNMTPLQLSPMGLTMHPGPQGQCAVVRFTAPATGTYRLMGRFWGQNDSAGGTNTRTMVVPSVGPVIDTGNVVGVGTPRANPFSGVVNLSTGDTIDFLVGANGSFISDSTGLHGYIQRDE